MYNMIFHAPHRPNSYEGGCTNSFDHFAELAAANAHALRTDSDRGEQSPRTLATTHVAGLHLDFQRFYKCFESYNQDWELARQNWANTWLRPASPST